MVCWNIGMTTNLLVLGHLMSGHSTLIATNDWIKLHDLPLYLYRL